MRESDCSSLRLDVVGATRVEGGTGGRAAVLGGAGLFREEEGHLLVWKLGAVMRLLECGICVRCQPWLRSALITKFWVPAKGVHGGLRSPMPRSGRRCGARARAGGAPAKGVHGGLRSPMPRSGVLAAAANELAAGSLTKPE